MSFFAITRRPDTLDFEVEKLDVNLWALPGLFGQQVFYCDVGVRLRLTDPSDGGRRLKFDLTVPFKAESDKPLDLVPTLRGSSEICNLIFGTNGAQLDTSNGLARFSDGHEKFLFIPVDHQDTGRYRGNNGDETKKDAAETAASSWTISLEAHQLPAGTSIYSRLRFIIDKPRRLWVWQHGERRKSHAVSDFRVNDFRIVRGDGEVPDFSRSALNITRANVFMIASSRYKVGRVSPTPKYVRILEGAGWERYLQRTLSRRGEDFVITYWAANSVTPDSPLRSFIEMERRRPTAMKASLTAAAIILAAWILLSPLNDFSQSYAYQAVQWTWLKVLGISAATIGILVRALGSAVRNRAQVKRMKKRWLQHRYRLPS